MKYKVLITTAGVGSRLGDITTYTNKALVRIGTKPAISHIIDSYPADTNFVVSLGYFGNHVRDFLLLAYPNHHIEFIEVQSYIGPGISLGKHMLEAKRLLQCPFIFHACDTLITEPVPLPTKNWIGVHVGDDTDQYASWIFTDGRLQFSEKGAIKADYVHIGLVGIHDFRLFWKELEALYLLNPENRTLNDCQVLARMIAMGSSMKIVEFPVWRDIGNVAALQAARHDMGYSPDDLDKSGEAIFMFDKFVIKFFTDSAVVRNRAERGNLLKGFVPAMEGAKENFYRYKMVPGELYSHIVQPQDFRKFLTWAQKCFWKREDSVSHLAFEKACHSFYHDKTKKRISQFLEANNLKDVKCIINGEHVPPLKTMFKKIDFRWLSRGLQSRFHGDFILDNILKTKNGYCLLDWRQDFGGLLQSGDCYYDLAKLNHNLTVNHRIINRELFRIESDGREVLVELMRPTPLIDCQAVFFDFLREKKYDARKVKLITSLIWLNMAPLHRHPFNLFLYYFGKLHLWRALKA